MANRVTAFTQIQTLSGNIPASTYYDNNIGPAFSALNDSSLGYNNGISTDTGSANNYIVASAFGVASGLNPGSMITFLPANTNTGASTLTWDTQPAAAIVDYAGNALIPGAIQAGKLTAVFYISGAFRLLYTSVPQLLFLNQIPTTLGSKTFNCQGSPWVSILLDATTAPAPGTITLALTNVVLGCHIKSLILPKAGTQIFKWTAPDTGGNNITKITSNYPTSAGSGIASPSLITDLIANGDTNVANDLIYSGFYGKETGGANELAIRFMATFS